MKTVLLLALLLVSTFAAQVWPGTSNRPILSDTEAALYTKATYLQGWTPTDVATNQADYIVGTGYYSTIQAAVNDAINAGGTTRKYIRVLPGTYKNIIIIPDTTVPITVYGSVGDASQVVITQTQGALTTGTEYAELNGGLFQSGDPAYSIYAACAERATIGTSCSGVFYAKAANFEIAYVTIDNPSIDGQAVAARAGGDMQVWQHVNLNGFQDTFYLHGTRVYINQATIKGDVDFVFGSSAAVFESCTFIGRADRPRSTALIFAPNTEETSKYGFLVINSQITAETAIASKKGLHLGRAWDSSSGNANGQLVIRESSIDDVVSSSPWDTATGGKRQYKGNVNVDRDLDDPNYNRFWEYKNTGAGA